MSLLNCNLNNSILHIFQKNIKKCIVIYQFINLVFQIINYYHQYKEISLYTPTFVYTPIVLY